MSLAPPLRNPQGDRPATPRPGGPETGVYIFELYYTASKRYFRAPETPQRGNLVLQHVAAQRFTEPALTDGVFRGGKPGILPG